MIFAWLLAAAVLRWVLALDAISRGCRAWCRGGGRDQSRFCRAGGRARIHITGDDEGVITSVALFFPLGIYALATWPADSKTVSGGILLGIGWMFVPLTVVLLRRALSHRR